MFRNLFKPKKPNFPTLEFGNYNPIILGTEYSQDLLKSLYRSNKDKILLTLTPICQYQINQKWPDPPFVNINLYGSKATEKYNWLGYIPFMDPREINFSELLEKKGNMNIYAKITKYRGEYGIDLFVSDEYKPHTLESFISHEKSHIEMLNKVAHDTGVDFIKVNVYNSKDGKNYIFKYNNKIIGSATKNKIDKARKNQPIKETFVRIAHFRFAEDNNHFSRIVMVTK